MLLMLVSLLCCVPAAKACLQCDRSIRLRDDVYILQASTIVIQMQLENIRRHAYNTFRETSRERMGIIDATTFYRVKTEYQSEFDRFLSQPLVGSVPTETIQIMTLGRQILTKHLDRFIKLCPNRCGLLRRRVLDCISCQYKTHVCPSPVTQPYCDSSSMLAFEGDQVVLNCFQPWHRLLLEKTEYHYSWSPYLPGYLNENDFTVLVVTDDSSVILNQVQARDTGTYYCSLQSRSGTVFYRANYQLAVVPKPNTTHQPAITLPSLPLVESQSFQPVKDLLVPVIVMVTALSLAACVGLAVVLRMMMSQRRAAEEKRRRRMEGKNTQEDTVYSIFTLHFDSHQVGHFSL
ncbi:izumo sperm-egg fusion protein 1-like isoform X2 [Sebastes fasciatus]|uniref:izumo sperm-egg fusion protein 1-like isoform X2 n=1 Tax=Sebastes fasciatus TaxID=394691 RepID=UPI003D9F727D